MAQVNYHVLEGTTNLYVKSENVKDSHIKRAMEAAASAPSSAAMAKPNRSYAYRKMNEVEFNKTIEQGRMAYAQNTSKPTAEKWYTESLDHTRQFSNKGVKGPQKVAEFEMNRQQYTKIRDAAVPQKGSSRIQPSEGPPKNLFNRERLTNHPKGKVNIGLKGSANVDTFNNAVVSVAEVHPNSLMNKSVITRWIRRNKLYTGGIAISVVLDGVNIVLSIIEDGGTIGKNTTVSVAGIAGGLAGSYVAAEIGAAIGSLFPGFGTLIGMLGGFVGYLLASGFASLFFGWNHVSPGPGQPLLKSDPYDAVFTKPSLGVDDGIAYGAPEGQWDTGMARGPPEGKWDTSAAFGHPDAGFDTRH